MAGRCVRRWCNVGLGDAVTAVTMDQHWFGAWVVRHLISGVSCKQSCWLEWSFSFHVQCDTYRTNWVGVFYMCFPWCCDHIPHGSTLWSFPEMAKTSRSSRQTYQQHKHHKPSRKSRQHFPCESQAVVIMTAVKVHILYMRCGIGGIRRAVAGDRGVL